MRAASITELGPADAIRVGELPTPVPGPTDVLVRVELVVVDPVDTLVRSGAYRTPTPFPFVIGRDLVGTVAEAGAGAAGLRSRFGGRGSGSLGKQQDGADEEAQRPEGASGRHTRRS